MRTKINTTYIGGALVIGTTEIVIWLGVLMVYVGIPVAVIYLVVVLVKKAIRRKRLRETSPPEDDQDHAIGPAMDEIGHSIQDHDESPGQPIDEQSRLETLAERIQNRRGTLRDRALAAGRETEAQARIEEDEVDELHRASGSHRRPKGHEGEASMTEAIERLELALRSAQEVERANKAGGSPGISTAYDAGRVAGLREALDIILKL